MFLAIVFIVMGLLMLLNAMGVIAGNFWGFFWAIVFIALGFKMMAKKGKCPMCEGMWFNKKMHGHCCDHDHGAGEAKHDEQN